VGCVDVAVWVIVGGGLVGVDVGAGWDFLFWTVGFVALN